MSFTSHASTRSWLLALALGLGFLVASTSVARADPADPTVIKLHIGESAAVTQAGLSRLAVGDPSVADAHPTGDDTAEVVGVSEGKTTLLVWDSANHRTAYLVDVTR